MEIYNPWCHLPDGAQVIRTTLAQAPAYTDGRATIWLDTGLTQAEARCALTHELIHLEHGHDGHQEPRIEARVRREAARRLVSPIIGGLCPDDDPVVWAEEQQITVAVLLDWIRTEAGR